MTEIVIIIIIIISFMQGICNYIPETNYVPREYRVVAILMLLFTVLISLVSVFNLLCTIIIIVVVIIKSYSKLQGHGGWHTA